MTDMLTVDKVEGPNDNGWYEVIFENGVKASTKNEDMAKTAFQSRGSEVPVVLTERVSGKFTNVYLNEIDGFKDAAKPKKSAARMSDTPAKSGRTKEDNERIARQWAYGRAVELFIASGSAGGALPLTSTNTDRITEIADWLISVTK